MGKAPQIVFVTSGDMPVGVCQLAGEEVLFVVSH